MATSPASGRLLRAVAAGVVALAIALAAVAAGPLCAAPVQAAPGTTTAPVFPGRPTGFVWDGTGTLSAAERQTIESLLTTVEKATTAELAVVLVAETAPITPKDYAVQLFERWGIGKKAKNNGLLAVVALKEREIQVEIGYGLEPMLPDGLVGAVLDRAVVPAFREGRFAVGLTLMMRVFAGVVAAKQEQVLPEGIRLGKDEIDYYTGLSSTAPADAPGRAAGGIGGSAGLPGGTEGAVPVQPGPQGVIATLKSLPAEFFVGTVIFLILLLLTIVGVIPWRLWLVILNIIMSSRRGGGGDRGSGGFGGFGGGRSGGGGAGRGW
jgi:uncharacterized protein